MARDTKRRILKAAKSVFVEMGKEGARVDAIAKRARVNKAMIYYYFSSKDQLYYQVLKTTFQKVMTRVLGALEQDGSPIDRVDEIVRIYHNYLLQDSDLPKMVLRELVNGAPVLQRVFSEVLGGTRQGLTAKFTQTLEQGSREGLIREMDTMQVTLSLLGMILFPFIAEPVMKSLFVSDSWQRFWEERPGQVSDILFHGIQARQSHE
jgi:TetR/AcrR family transcriptional regulator